MAPNSLNLGRIKGRSMGNYGTLGPSGRMLSEGFCCLWIPPGWARHDPQERKAAIITCYCLGLETERTVWPMLHPPLVM